MIHYSIAQRISRKSDTIQFSLQAKEEGCNCGSKSVPKKLSPGEIIQIVDVSRESGLVKMKGLLLHQFVARPKKRPREKCSTLVGLYIRNCNSLSGPTRKSERRTVALLFTGYSSET